MRLDKSPKTKLIPGTSPPSDCSPPLPPDPSLTLKETTLALSCRMFHPDTTMSKFSITARQVGDSFKQRAIEFRGLLGREGGCEHHKLADKDSRLLGIR